MAHPMESKPRRSAAPVLSAREAAKLLARQQAPDGPQVLGGADQLAALLAQHTTFGHVFQEIAVGPEWAAAALVRNSENRPIRKTRVKIMARAMQEKRYRDRQPHPICFDFNGVLRDGQHRLGAVVESDCTIVFTVCFGCHPDERDFYDQGVPRSVADIAREHGHNNVVLAQSLVALILRVELGSTASPDRVEQTDRLDELFAEPEFAAILKFGYRLRALVPPSTAALALWQIATHTAHRDKLDDFVEQLSKGALLAEHSPVLRVRNQLASERGSNGRDRAVRRAGSIVMAWNAHMERRRPRSFKWDSTISLPQVA